MRFMLEQFVDLEEQPYSEEDAEWDAFVAQHPHGSLLQTTNWARLKSRFIVTIHGPGRGSMVASRGTAATAR